MQKNELATVGASTISGSAILLATMEQSEARRQLANIKYLERDWDSYDAAAISPVSCRWAEYLLDEILEWGGSEPWVVPTSSGGVQLEWHEKGIDLEVEIALDGSFDIFFAKGTQVLFQRNSTDTDPTILRLALRWLVQRFLADERQLAAFFPASLDKMPTSGLSINSSSTPV